MPLIGSDMYKHHGTWVIILTGECGPLGQMVTTQNTARWLCTSFLIRIDTSLNLIMVGKYPNVDGDSLRESGVSKRLAALSIR